MSWSCLELPSVHHPHECGGAWLLGLLSQPSLRKKSKPPVVQVPHSIHCPRGPGGGCRVGPWGNFPSKNQSPGIGPPSWGGDGNMFPTSKLKTPGPLLNGDRRYSLPSTTLVNLGRPLCQPRGQDPSKNQSSLIFTRLSGVHWSTVNEWLRSETSKSSH